VASAEDPMSSANLKECHPMYVSITLRHFSHNYHGTRTAAAAVCLYVSLPRRSNTHTHTHTTHFPSTTSTSSFAPPSV
jgi:hypothetical protein